MDYSSLTEQEIWNLFLSGDDQALAYIYNRHYSSLLAYGVKLRIEGEAVRDCIQDIFVRMYTNRKNLRKEIHINSYLVRSLRNRIYDEFNQTVENLAFDKLEFEFTDEDFFTQYYIDSDEDLLQKDKLKKALTTLTSNQKEVLYLRFVREFSYHDIAEILHINYQSVKNLITRSLVKLRKELNT